MRLLWGRYGWYLELGEAPTKAAVGASEAGQDKQLAAAAGSAPAAAAEEPGKAEPAGKGRPGRMKKAGTAAAAKPKPRRASLGKSADAPDISLEDALRLLAWPKARAAAGRRC